MDNNFIKLFFFKLVLISMLLPSSLQAEAFGNNILTIPSISMHFFSDPIIKNAKSWGIKEQFGIGANFARSLDYKFWWYSKSAVSFGKTLTTNNYLSSVTASTGFTYNFLDDDIRPNISLLLSYLQLLGSEAKTLDIHGSLPIWVGPNLILGLEFLIFSEMSLSIDLSYAFYLNFDHPFRHLTSLGIGYGIYF